MAKVSPRNRSSLAPSGTSLYPRKEPFLPCLPRGERQRRKGRSEEEEEGDRSTDAENEGKREEEEGLSKGSFLGRENGPPISSPLLPSTHKSAGEGKREEDDASSSEEEECGWEVEGWGAILSGFFLSLSAGGKEE